MTFQRHFLFYPSFSTRSSRSSTHLVTPGSLEGRTVRQRTGLKTVSPKRQPHADTHTHTPPPAERSDPSALRAAPARAEGPARPGGPSPGPGEGRAEAFPQGSGSAPGRPASPPPRLTSPAAGPAPQRLRGCPAGRLAPPSARPSPARPGCRWALRAERAGPDGLQRAPGTSFNRCEAEER